MLPIELTAGRNILNPHSPDELKQWVNGTTEFRENKIYMGNTNVAYLWGEVHQDFQRAEVILLEVNESFRRLGIGTELLQQFERVAREKGATQVIIPLAPLDENQLPRQVAFYTQHGYIEENPNTFTKTL